MKRVNTFRVINKSWLKIIIGSFLLFCIILCGCDRQNQEKNSAHNIDKEVNEYEKYYVSLNPVDVLNIKWKRNEALVQCEEWQVQNYVSPLFQVQSGAEQLIGCRTDNEKLYALYYHIDSGQDEAKIYSLREIDLTTMEQNQWPIVLEQENLITDFDVSDGKICIFLEQYAQEKGTTGLFAQCH